MKNYFIIIIILTADDKRNETALDTSGVGFSSDAALRLAGLSQDF